MIGIIRGWVAGFIEEHQAQQKKANDNFKLMSDAIAALDKQPSKLVVVDEFVRCFYASKPGETMPVIEAAFRRARTEFDRGVNDLAKKKLLYSDLTQTSKGRLSAVFADADGGVDETAMVSVCDLKALFRAWSRVSDIHDITYQSLTRNEGLAVADVLKSVRLLSPYDGVVFPS